MDTLKRSRAQAWPEETGDREHGLYSLHRMFDIVGTHLTHRDVRVLSFLFVDVIDDYERGMIRSGRDFLLALERQGRCDETNFRQVLQLLRIITRHDLLPYVTLKRRRAVCPDLVDKYLEETSIRYVMPRAHSNAEHGLTHPHKSVPPHHPVVCRSSAGPPICTKRPGRGRALLSSQHKRRKSMTPDPKEKQTCASKRCRNALEQPDKIVLCFRSGVLAQPVTRHPPASPSRVLPARDGAPGQRLLQQAGSPGAAVRALQPGQHHLKIPGPGLYHL
ncbi:death effector domain-containing protein isoform X2 [Gopherus flavomarginatus]|uniref:death effector domain-containing protein isoform X2 n=1 Tax=Gopherus flavomarginatus TaxID=286002 RepID=UPI0021CB9BFE|nr:death effector domain-containing protein isoform X2 [Gopherus flavomarginatus]